jgi:SAM-dependent methyltransferase
VGVLKQRVKDSLEVVGLYKPFQRLWVRRADLRLFCWNAGYRLAGSTDGLPIPPARLVYLVANSREISWFLKSGTLGRESILYALRKNGIHPEEFEAILDFGCGCGRIMRHWQSLQGPQLYGTDYNPDLISWCHKNLNGLAEFKTNNLVPPLDFANEQFDFIYAISIFTHLTEDLQQAWMNELARVLRPGGLLLITVHGVSRLRQLESEDQRRFRSGEMVIKEKTAVGSNVCGAYHPEQYVRNRLAVGFEIVDFIPVGARDADQDVFLLRKPAMAER